MYQELTNSQKPILTSTDFSPIISNITSRDPLVDKYEQENYIFNEIQSLLLNEFISKNNNISEDNIIKYMLKIFSPHEANIEEISNSEDNIYCIQSNRKKNKTNELDTTNKSFDSFSKINQNKNPKNIFISEVLTTPIKEDSLNSNLEKSFISKKRKNPDIIIQNNGEANKHISNQKNKTKEITHNTYAPISEKSKIVKYQYRLDYYKKAFKVNCFKHLTKFLNYLLSKCNLPNKEFKNKKIFKPNNEYFTSNAKEEDNYIFLYMKLKDIFCYIKNDNKSQGISLQKSNKQLIDMILNYFEQKGNNYSKDYENLKKYLNMSMEEYIKIYYDTDEFKKFCKEEKIQFYEKEFIKEKKFGMLEKYGFLRLIKMYQKNENKNFSYGLKSIHSKMNGINSV